MQMCGLQKHAFSRVYAHLRRRWKSSLALAALLLVAWDQRRRSRLAAIRFACLYQEWLQKPSTRQELQRLRDTVNAELAKHDPAGLRARFAASSADFAAAGGGSKSVYAFGAYLALQHAGITVTRVSGASAGAYIALLFLNNRVALDDILDAAPFGWPACGWGSCVLQAILEYKTLFLGKIWAYMAAEQKRMLGGVVPSVNTCFISVTTLGLCGPREGVVGEYSGPEDLEQTVLASMSIPFILCDGLFLRWRGKLAVDGGIRNNCPMHVFVSKPAREGERRIIVKADGNKMPGLSLWDQARRCVFAPTDVLFGFILQGMHDMLAVLTTDKLEVNGVSVLPPGSSFQKRELSYQVLPGPEHVRRTLSGRPVF